MSSWHVSETALRRWIDRSDSLAEGASVEQHLLSCGQCRELVAAAVTRETAFDLVDLAGVGRGPATRSSCRARRHSSGCCCVSGCPPTTPS